VAPALQTADSKHKIYRQDLEDLEVRNRLEVLLTLEDLADQHHLVILVARILQDILVLLDTQDNLEGQENRYNLVCQVYRLGQ
jgi:hypothetical protein